MHRYILPVLIALCTACRTRLEVMHHEDALEWTEMFQVYEPAVKEVLSSNRQSPTLWATKEDNPFTSELGIHIPVGWQPERKVVVHELAHWHNPKLGELPAIVEEGVALSVVFSLGMSSLVVVPELHPPYEGAVDNLYLSYDDFSQRADTERWFLVAQGFAIVHRIGLPLLTRMSDTSPEAIASAAYLR